MKMNDKFFTPDEFVRQIHKILKELYPSMTASGDDVRRNLRVTGTAEKAIYEFQTDKFASQFRIESDLMMKKIYSELLIEYEKNWHDRIFFKILKNDKSISIETAGKKDL